MCPIVRVLGAVLKKLFILLLISSTLWAKGIPFKGQFKCEGLLDDGESVKMEVSLNVDGGLSWKKYDLEFHTYSSNLSFYQLNGFERIKPNFGGNTQYLNGYNMKSKKVGDRYSINIKDYLSQLTTLIKFGLIADVTIDMEFIKSGETLKISVDSVEGKMKSKSSALFFCHKKSSIPKFSKF